MSVSVIGRVAGIPELAAADVVDGGTGADIQAALDNLVSGRDYYQKVIVRGDIAVSTQIDVDSWTVLEINGRLTSTLTTGSVFSAANKSNFIIQGGGYIDCADITGTSNGIDINTCTDFIVQDLTIFDANAHSINIQLSSAGLVTKCTLDTMGDDGVSILTSHGIRVIGNEILNATSDVGGSTGVEIEDSSSRITVMGNNIHDMTGRGVSTVTDAAGDGANSEITIEGNTIYDCTLQGINCENAKTSLTGITIAGDGTDATVTVTAHNMPVGTPFTISSATQPGFDDETIVGTVTDANNFTYANPTSATVTNGVLTFFETNVSVIGNVIRGCTQYGIRTYNSHNLNVNGNQVSNSGISGFISTGCDRLSIQGNTFANAVGIGVNIGTSNNVAVIGNIVHNAGTVASKQAGIATNTVENYTLSNNITRDTKPTATTHKNSLWNVTGDILISDNVEEGLTTGGRSFGGTTDGQAMIVRGNTAFPDSKRGIATISAASSSIAVNHGLFSDADWTKQLDIIQVTPAEDMTPAVRFWVSNITTTQFTINTDVNVTADTDFVWWARIDMLR